MDEDREGVITLKEYQDALESYGCAGEKHISFDTTEYYAAAEHRSIFNLLDILKEKNMQPSDLANICGIDDG